MENTYAPHHPWYYKLGGKVLYPKQIISEVKKSGYRGYKRKDIEDVEAYLDHHGSRLRSLNEAGIVENIGADRFSVPKDVVERGEKLNASRGEQKIYNRAQVKIISGIDIGKQVDAHARTFLDLEIYRDQNDYNLSYEHADKATLCALSERKDWLVENGYASYKVDMGAFVMKGDALGKLYEEEMESVAVRLSKKFDAPVKNLDKTEKQVVQFFGYTEIYSGQYMIVGQDGAVSLIKGKFDVSKVRIGEALNVDPTGKHTKVARIIFDRNKEEAIDRVSKKFGMDYEEMHVTENVRVGFIGAVNLRDDVYAAVEHNNLLSFVKVREYPIYESGQELEVSSGKGGFVEINEVEDQKELKLKQEKEIDDDWGGF